MFRTKLWPFCCYRGGGGGQLSAVKRTVNVLKNAGIFFCVCLQPPSHFTRRPGKASGRERIAQVSPVFGFVSAVHYFLSQKEEAEMYFNEFFLGGGGAPFSARQSPSTIGSPPPPFIESKGELLDRLNRRLEFVDVHSPVTYKHMT